jgi:hypothetical protein
MVIIDPNSIPSGLTDSTVEVLQYSCLQSVNRLLKPTVVLGGPYKQGYT